MLPTKDEVEAENLTKPVCLKSRYLKQIFSALKIGKRRQEREDKDIDENTF